MGQPALARPEPLYLDDPDERAARYQARLRALHAARRAAYRDARGDPDRFRRLMRDWLRENRPPTRMAPGTPRPSTTTQET